MLSTMNSQPGMMVIVHLTSQVLPARHNQLLRSRSDGQQPIETSHLKAVGKVNFLKGHGFSRAVNAAKAVRLQPLRDGFLSMRHFSNTRFRHVESATLIQGLQPLNPGRSTGL
jgi:hypothetical protein